MCIDCPDELTRRGVIGGAGAMASLGLGFAASSTPAGQAVEIIGGASKIPARFFAGSSPHDPAVVVAHGNPGFDDNLLKYCGDLAQARFNVLSVDWTRHGPPPPSDPKDFPTWRKATVGNMQFWREGAKDLAASFGWLQKKRLVTSKAVFALGICGGGSVIGAWAPEAAFLSGIVLFHAAVRFRTEMNDETPSVDLIDFAEAIPAPIQSHAGCLDDVALARDIREFEQRRAREMREDEYYYYPEAGHGFVLEGPSFSPESKFGYSPFASRQATARAIQFMSRRSGRKYE